ncbi:SdpI family protein [Myroides marinus]|uniref:SdpI family protein n=1 Tax=Myroides marinus TaxID=703342 RepID=UPI0025789DA6|nr:SdpI family protein [Myroides marinus]MDM1370430.1 SdpI family protein [Myroides marinus]
MIATHYILFPVLFIILGLIAPHLKTINGIIGYKTYRAMKNQRNWDYAQKYSDRCFIYVGLATLPFIAIDYFNLIEPKLLTSIFFVGITLTFAFIIYKTEQGLKRLESQ